jgi:hypothetical protein
MLRGNRVRRRPWAAALLGLALAASASADDDTDRAIASLRAVGREGKGNDTAGPAWKTLVGQGGPALFPALAAIDDANPTAANWLRSAAGAIAEAETKAGRKLPADKLEAFAKDTKFAGSARRTAYELLAGQDPTATDRLLPGFLNDKNPDLRRDAIATELAKAEKLTGDPLKAELRRLFAVSRDRDQVEDLAKRLTAAGEKASVMEHFGFITRWQVIGPFDSAEGKALTTVHPPETKLATDKPLPGKGGAEVKWVPAAAGAVRDPMSGETEYGNVDLTKAIGKIKDAAAYATAVVRVERDTPAEIRVTSPNAVQIFHGGKKFYEKEEYHHGAPFDGHAAKVTLKAGDNTIVVKVCQNNQSEPWAQPWQFSARVCDPTGGPLSGAVQRVPAGTGFESVKLGLVADAPETKEEKK